MNLILIILLALLWMLSGYLSWANLNYNSYISEPENDKCLVKWVVLFTSIGLGLLAVPINWFIIRSGISKFHFGFRFK